MRAIVSQVAIGAITIASVALVVSAFSLARFYIAPDAGHYLADADALIGRGVRENRHPPLFPGLINLVRLFAPDKLLTIRVTIALSVALLVVCFFIFIRNRTGSILGDIAATGLFALAPTTAELVGWFGGSSLVGIALSLVALRLMSDVVARPTLMRAIAGAIAVAGVVLSHPFSAGFLAETALAYVVLILMANALRRRRLTTAWKPVLQRARLLLVIAGGGLLAVLGARDFYGGIQNPFVIAPSAQQLSLLWSWAFREDPTLWLSLLGLSMALIPLARLSAGERGVDLGLTVTALNIAVLCNVALLQANSSYVTRSLYFVPVAIAAAFGVGLAALVRVIARACPSFRLLKALAPAALAVLVGALALQSFTSRLDGAIPYYNVVDQQELAAIHYLAGRNGTVVVSSNGANLNAGTQYSWLIEGLARERAIGYGTSGASLYPADAQETNDAERFLAGPAVAENGRLRVAFDGTQQSVVRVFGDVDGTWYRLFDLAPRGGALLPSTISMPLGPAGGEISSSSNAVDPPATLRLDAAGHMLHVSIPAQQLASNGEVDISPADGSACSVDLCSTQGISRPNVAGSNIDWAASFEGRSVRVSLSTANASGVPAEAVTTPTGIAVHALAPNQGLIIDVDVAGLTGPSGGVSLFTQEQLIRDQNIQYLWTWRNPQAVEHFAARSCVALTYQNDEIAIFRVDQNCRG